MWLKGTIAGANKAPRLADPKYEVHLCGFVSGVSKTRAVDTFARLTGMSLDQSKWFLGQLPQKLAVPAVEYFQGVVMTEAEAQQVDALLSQFFELQWSQAGGQVLTFGMTTVAPWSPTRVPPTASA
jgi:hypothetical protein